MTTAAVLILLLANGGASPAVDLNGWGQTVFNVIVGAISTYLLTLKSDIAKARGERDAKIEELAEAKFEQLAGELRTSVEVLSQQLGQFAGDVEKGERLIEGLRAETRKLEVAGATANGDLRGWMLENFVTKKDFREWLTVELRRAGR